MDIRHLSTEPSQGENMSRKKSPRRKDAKKRKAKKRKPASRAERPAIIDPRATEKMTLALHRMLSEQQFSSIDEANAFLANITHISQISPPEREMTPVEQAQDLMYEAWNAAGTKTRVKMARQALEISPDCADAYVLLAEETAVTPEEARKLYEEGVRAGERALGAEAFTEMAGNFWSILETRPYMRAREGLARCLWALGEEQAAIDHYAEMLRLNPNDNQGIRYDYLRALLSTPGNDERIEALLEQYPEDIAAAWTYSRALWFFRRGDERANSALREAFENNPLVPIYFLSIKKMPSRPPEFIGLGDDSEAVMYVAENAEIWLETPGALQWFVDQAMIMAEEVGGDEIDDEIDDDEDDEEEE